MAERSKELIMVGYFLSRFGKNNPPERLRIARWKDAYKVFYNKLREGHSVSQFEHSLRNSRDAFDGYFSETEREGWKSNDGSPSKLTGYSLEVYNDYANLSEEEVFLKIENFISPYTEKEGFEITPKNDPIKILIENYKRQIAKTQLKDEVYKWELVNQYRGRPNPEAPDFYQEIKDVKFKNLIYAMGMAVINHLAKYKPEALRQLFINLYDESKDLTERVKSFNKETLKIYRELGETLQHHQDERSIATYLTFHNPDKYTLYKSTFYKKYCKLLGIKAAKKNEKYTHYLKLIDELIENYIAPDSELIEQVKLFIPDYYNGTNHKLLAQDILFQMLNKNVETNYWVFQGNPKVFDFEAAIADGTLDNFTVSAHKDKIRVGDKVIIWLAGNSSGCYALAEITSEPTKVSVSRDDKHWKVKDPNDIKAGIKITHNLFNHPILWNDIKDYTEFAKFKGGNQGSNFSATEEEYLKLLDMSETKNIQYWLYAPGENASKWDEFYESGKMALGWDAIGDLRQYESRDALRDALINAYGGKGSKKNDVSANDDFVNKMHIGDIIIAKKGRGKLLGYGVVTSDYYFDDNRIDYKSYRKIDWKLKGNWKVDFSLVLKTLTDVTQYYSDDTKTMTYYNELLNIMGQNTNKKSKKIDLPLNTILYGPPGTGKTYALKKDYFPLYTSKETSITEEKNFEAVVKGCSWWEVIAVALIQLGESKVNDIFSHKWVQKKAELSNSKTVKPTLWGQLQSHTIETCEYVNVKSRQQPLIFNKTENSTWQIIAEEVENQIPELYDLIEKVENFKPNPDKVIERFKFVTFHQSFSYEDFIEGIKPIMPENGEVAEDLGYKIEDGVFKDICEDARNDPDNKYAIFIDEINRGNVSAIFGELITLIETDKRKGSKNEMFNTLPYSKNKFSVPSNLDIYGTMNTADRSVEALDTALRRRFEFKEMMPDCSVIEDENIEGIQLAEVLETINQRIELLVDRDHTIGHSYFVNVNTTKALANAFNNKIVPLLQEYFYGDYGKIGLVLGKGFIEKVKNDKIEFASFTYENSHDFKTPTFVLKQVDSTSVVEAVNLLLGKEEEKEIG